MNGFIILIMIFYLFISLDISINMNLYFDKYAKIILTEDEQEC